MGSELETLLGEMIPRSVAFLLRRGGPVGSDDLEQDLWLAALERAAELEEHRLAGRDEAVRRILETHGKWVLRKEERERRTRKALEAGYTTGDECFYSLGSLRRLVPQWMDWTEGAREGLLPDGDGHVTLMDLDRAMSALRPYHSRLLERYFAYPPRYMVEWEGTAEIHGWTHAEVASSLGMDPATLGSRVHHALKALQKQLGDQNPWNRGPSPKRGKK